MITMICILYNVHVNSRRPARHAVRTERIPSKRQEVKKLIRELKQTNPFVEGNIFKSVENVNLSTVIAYKDGNGKHSFLDTYDKVDDK